MRRRAASGIQTGENVRCPTTDDLLAYFDRRLAPPAVLRIAAHIDECESCRLIVVTVVRCAGAARHRSAGNS